MCKKFFKAMKIKMDNYHLRYELAGADEIIKQQRKKIQRLEEENKRLKGIKDEKYVKQNND